MDSDRFTSYMILLKTRQTGYRRGLILTGGTFLFAILATIGFGRLTGWNGRYMVGLLAIDVLLIVGLLMAWVRLEITKEKIELMQHLSG